MRAAWFAKLPAKSRLAALDTRAGRVALWVMGVTGFVLGFVYHGIVFLSGKPAAMGLAISYNVVVLLAAAALWLLLSLLFQRRPASTARLFWSTLFVGGVVLGSSWLVSLIGRPSAAMAYTAGFDYETGVPLTLATVLKMNLLSLLEVTFAFVLLLRFRDLVLFKRSRSSQRNWYLMLGLMVFASLLVFMRPPQSETHWLDGVVMVPAVLFMVINSFRLSWIVFLSFREKIASIGLSLLLLVLLAFKLASMDDAMAMGVIDITYFAYYSQPLIVFSTLALIFGILYCTTAFLSLLFHLPTTGDFQRKEDELAAMHSLTNLVSQVFDLERLLATIAASPVEAGAASATWLAVRDLGSGSLRPQIVATHNMDPVRVMELVDVQAFYDELSPSREPLLLEQAPADHRISAGPGEGIGSLLVIPLVARDEMLGALFVTSEVAHGFEKDDVRAMGVFAAQAALALDNARLFEEQVEKERLERELSIAREVQQKLLPQCLPVIEGASICASSVPAQEVGGDYYDYVHLGPHRLAFIVADVSGKGASAAFYMAELQGVFKAIAPIAPDPKDFLSHANRALSETLEKNVFISVLYGVLDTQKEELVLARAGHCPAATIDLNGSARFLRTRGLGLGLDNGPLFRKTLAVERHRLQPGDVFVLYTDGVVESRSPQGEEYGYERLLDALRENRHEDADTLHDAVLAHLNGFIVEGDYGDDMTLLVLKWHGITLPSAKEQRANGAENPVAGSRGDGSESQENSVPAVPASTKA